MTKCALGKVMRLMVSAVMAASLCPAASYAQEFELSGSEMGVVSASDDEQRLAIRLTVSVRMLLLMRMKAVRMLQVDKLLTKKILVKSRPRLLVCQ